jgi:prepilin-type N-terminal cleavage/methylation domain-containing protein
VPSSERRLARRHRQAGFGLVEVLVASALLGVGIVVILGSLGSLLVGARVAERHAVEARLVRNQLEWAMAQSFQELGQADCSGFPTASTVTVDGVAYGVSLSCTVLTGGFVEYQARATAATGGTVVLSVDRAGLP